LAEKEVFVGVTDKELEFFQAPEVQQEEVDCRPRADQKISVERVRISSL